jgi:helicase
VYDFFGETFYAHQYDPKAIKLVISRILKFLFDEKMINVAGREVFATRFGRRVSELYIDPISAVLIRDGLQSRAPVITDLSFLHLIAHTPDMYPKLRPYASEIDKLALFVDEHKEEFMFDPPGDFDERDDFEEFLGEAKVAQVGQAWIEEVTEDQMLEQFRVQPGDLYRLIDSAKWLLYAARELAKLLGHKDLTLKINKLRERSAKGVKAELLPLVRLDGIGRGRGRILFDSGLKSIEDLKHAPIKTLVALPLIGPKVAKKIKEQVGGFAKSTEWKKLAREETPEQQSLKEYY